MSTPKRAVVVEADLVAPGVRRVRLRMGDGGPLGQRAGQYILLHAQAADGTVVKRAYSIASPPRGDACFDLCVRRVAEHPASEFVHGISVGTEVSFSGPWGKFVVDDDTRDLTLVATGTAISCTGAILEHVLPRAHDRRLRLLWGLRHESDVHGVERLEALARAHPPFAFTIALSRPGSGWTGFRGRVTDALRAAIWPQGLYCLAGNGAMIAEAEELLYAAGVPATAIRKEIFFTPGQVRVSLQERQARAANRQRPGRAVVGVALHAGAPAIDVLKAVADALEVADLQPTDVRNVAVAAKASDEPGLIEAMTTLALPLEFYLPAELEVAKFGVEGPVGGCETLARVSAGSRSLILPKFKTPSVTVAIAPVADQEST